MRKYLKGIAVCISIAISMGLMSFTANAASVIKSTVLENGTIHTRTCNDNGNIEDMYYTPERNDLYLRKENSFTYLLNVSCNNNAEFEKTFSEVYGYTQMEDGSYDVYPSEVVYYNFGTNMTLDTAENMAEGLVLHSGHDDLCHVTGGGILTLTVQTVAVQYGGVGAAHFRHALVHQLHEYSLRAGNMLGDHQRGIIGGGEQHKVEGILHGNDLTVFQLLVHLHYPPRDSFLQSRRPSYHPAAGRQVCHHTHSRSHSRWRFSVFQPRLP